MIPLGPFLSASIVSSVYTFSYNFSSPSRKALTIKKIHTTHHVGRGIIACNGVVAHEKPENEYVSVAGNAEAIVRVEIGEDELSGSSFRRHHRNQNHEHHKP